MLRIRFLLMAILIALSGCGKAPPTRSKRKPRTGPGDARTASHAARPKPAVNKPGIKWRTWDRESFALAEKQGKLVLLSISASWCPWCRKMDEGTYSDPEIVKIVEKKYVPIRADSDERPDINSRYTQNALPTTALLTPKGEAVYAGTYFPSDQLKSTLDEIADLYRSRKREIDAKAESMARQMGFLQESPLPPDIRGVTTAIPRQVLMSLRTYYDEKYGGFDDQRNKFPRADAVDFLLYETSRTGERELLLMVNRTLGAMAAAGIYDHIAGGFFHYSVSSDWRMPHFAKLCDENANHVRNFLDAYQATGNGFYRRIAEETIDYVTHVLSDRADGGFYGSQARNDDYYTWSKEEVRQILTSDEAEIAVRYFGIGESRNETKSGSGEYVLNTGKSLQGLARELHLSANEVKERLARAVEKMRRFRNSQSDPAVDRRVFTDWSAAMASSFLQAGAVLERSDLSDFALKTLNRLMDRCYRSDIGMYHCLEEGKPHVSGLLADQVRMARALLDAYALTGEAKFLKSAKDLVSIMGKEFEDKKGGGYYDRIKGPDPIGRLAVLTRPLDTNALAARCMVRLGWITGDKKHEEAARRTLGAFTHEYEAREVAATGYALAVEEILRPPLRIVVLGPANDPTTRALLREAARFYEPQKIVIPVEPSEGAARLKALGLPAAPKPGLYPCYKNLCGEPVADPGRVARALAKFVEKNLSQEE